MEDTFSQKKDRQDANVPKLTLYALIITYLKLTIRAENRAEVLPIACRK
jgi:hypothetical protein